MTSSPKDRLRNLGGVNFLKALAVILQAPLTAPTMKVANVS